MRNAALALAFILLFGCIQLPFFGQQKEEVKEKENFYYQEENATEKEEYQKYTEEKKNVPSPLLRLYIVRMDGTGEAIILRKGEYAVLIDTGNGDENVIRMLKNAGVEKINYLFLTSNSKGRIGGIKKILQGFEVEKIYAPFAIENVSVTSYLSQGDAKVIDGVTIEVVWPKTTNVASIYNSMVLLIKYKNFSILLFSDLPGNAQRIVRTFLTGRGEKIDAIVLPCEGRTLCMNEKSMLINLGKIANTTYIIFTNADEKEQVLAKNFFSQFNEVFTRNGTIAIATNGEKIFLYNLQD